MSDKKQWVQYKNDPQGEKWKVLHGEDDADAWAVDVPGKNRVHWLPKSEYRLCETPVLWRDVSECARVGSDLSCILYDNLGREISVQNGYRLRKVHIAVGPPSEGVYQWAFVVEKKVS